MSLVNRTISKDSEKAFETWQNYDSKESDFCDIDDEEDPKMVFIDLLKNPERFTGYDGEAAHKGFFLPVFIRNFMIEPGCLRLRSIKMHYIKNDRMI